MIPTHIGILTYDLMKVNFLVHLFDFSEPFPYAIHFTFFCFGGLNRFENLMHRNSCRKRIIYRTFSFVFIHVCVQKTLSSINMQQISGREDGFPSYKIHPCWYNKNLLYFFIHSIHSLQFSQTLVWFSSNFCFPFRLNKEKRGKKKA